MVGTSCWLKAHDNHADNACHSAQCQYLPPKLYYSRPNQATNMLCACSISTTTGLKHNRVIRTPLRVVPNKGGNNETNVAHCN
uniref:Uncharacterized protein n=1 Tax=Arundo donax TaxID=35708 RepID=A0A0A9DTK1_ARUDO